MKVDSKSKNKSTTKLTRPKYDVPQTLSQRKKNEKKVECNETGTPPPELVFKNQLK